MRDMTVGVVAPAYVNLPLWVAQQRGLLERRGLRAVEQSLGRLIARLEELNYINKGPRR